jgi:hypothetical protein
MVELVTDLQLEPVVLDQGSFGATAPKTTLIYCTARVLPHMDMLVGSAPLAEPRPGNAEAVVGFDGDNKSKASSLAQYPVDLRLRFTVAGLRASSGKTSLANADAPSLKYSWHVAPPSLPAVGGGAPPNLAQLQLEAPSGVAEHDGGTARQALVGEFDKVKVRPAVSLGDVAVTRSSSSAAATAGSVDGAAAVGGVSNIPMATARLELEAAGPGAGVDPTANLETSADSDDDDDDVPELGPADPESEVSDDEEQPSAPVEKKAARKKAATVEQPKPGARAPLGAKVAVKWDATIHGKQVKKWYMGTVVKVSEDAGTDKATLGIDYDDGKHVEHKSQGLVLNVVGLAVQQGEYESALARRKLGTMLSADEVTLSHAISRGVVRNGKYTRLQQQPKVRVLEGEKANELDAMIQLDSSEAEVLAIMQLLKAALG